MDFRVAIVVCLETHFESVGIVARVGKSRARAGVTQRMKISAALGLCKNLID
jgi:hypothetical protein